MSIRNLKEKFPSMQNMEMGLGYTALDPPLQVLNISYPSVQFDTKDKSTEKLYGKAGLDRIMKYSKANKRNFEYRAETFLEKKYYWLSLQYLQLLKMKHQT